MIDILLKTFKGKSALSFLFVILQQIRHKVKLLHIDRCPLCGEKRFEKRMTCMDHYATGESFDLFGCVSCGFLFTQDVPVESEMGRYYATPAYISHSDTHKGIVNRVYHGVRRYMLSRKAALVRRSSGKSQGRLLDIGTGTGYFPHFMQEQGWTVTAVEKSEQARAFAGTHFGLKADSPEALAQYADASFDVITLWHVLEHLEHLNDTWDTLRRLLTEEGTLVIAVPNHCSYDAVRYGSFWAAYDVPRHLWHFDAGTMRAFAHKHGFRVKEIHPMPFDAFYVSMLSEKYLKHAFPFMGGLMTGAQAWMAALHDKLKSSSLIYVLKKEEAV